METSIRTDLDPSPRFEVLAEVSYTHREEDFIAWWMYGWDQMQNQCLHPRAHHLGSWLCFTLRRALAVALMVSLAAVVFRERFIDYILAAAACVFLGILGMGLASWFLRGPKGVFRELARRRYHRKMRRLVPEIAAQKIVVNLGRFHRLLLTPNSAVLLSEVRDIEPGTSTTERREIVTSWAVFDRIEVTDQHIFLIERRNWTTILPRRAFADEAACQQFVALAHRLHETAIRGDAPSVSWKQPEQRIMR